MDFKANIQHKLYMKTYRCANFSGTIKKNRFFIIILQLPNE